MQLKVSKIMSRVLIRLLEQEKRNQITWWQQELDEGRPADDIKYRLEIIKECDSIIGVLNHGDNRK